MEDNTLTFLSGVAGTSKTFCATAYAIWALSKGLYEKVYISRPVVSAAGEDLGYLPGSFEKKVHPYLEPIYDCMDTVLGGDRLLKQNLMKNVFVFPISYARGRTLNNAVCILDEAQNTTLTQMKLWLFRLGKESKMIVTGDPEQSDIGNRSCLNACYWATLNRKMNGVGHYTFPKEAIVRHPLVGDLIDVLQDVIV